MGTVMESSRIPLQKWLIAIYLHVTSLKGISSMKLHRELEITQKSAWFLSHRIREAYDIPLELLTGPVEVDETYIGGKRKNMNKKKRMELFKTGRGSVGKIAVIGMKDRGTNRVVAKPISDTTKETLHDFVNSLKTKDSMVYTDEHKSYKGLKNHETVIHSVSQYVNGEAHTNGIESFWAVLKRGYHGTFHQMSVGHLHRYINEFSSRHNFRDRDTIDQMQEIIAGMVGKRLMYKNLVKEA